MARTADIELDNTGNVEGDVTFTLMGDTQVFSLASPSLTLPLATNAELTVTCRSSTAGDYEATLRVTPGIDVVTPAYDITLRCQVLDTDFYALPSAIDLGEIRSPAAFRARLERDGAFAGDDPWVRSSCASAGLAWWLLSPPC